MSVAAELADLALDAARQTEPDLMRSYLLANLVAGIGASPAEPLLAAAGAAIGTATPGGRAHLLAGRLHFRTQDDFDAGGRVHVGAVVVPAVLSLAGGSVLGPMAAGYAVLTCVARAYRDEAEARGLRPTGVFGPIGSAAAAGVAAGMDRERLAGAIALSSVTSGGTNQSWVDGSDEWLLEVAAASRSGVEAALLAGGGARGAPSAFEGASGWARAYFGDEDATALRKQLAEPYRGVEAVALKRYPVSGIAQVPTALAAEVGPRLAGEVPERFEIHIVPRELAYPGSAYMGPFASRSQSLMSIARCAALGYLHGVVPLVSLVSPPTDVEEAVMRAVELVPDSELAEGAARIVVSCAGRVESASADCEEMLHPGWEALAGDVDGLAERCEAPVDAARRLRDAVGAGADANALLALLEGPGDLRRRSP